MLSARLTVVQVLGMFQVGIQITEFQAGEDPTTWIQHPLTLTLTDEEMQEDSLYIILRAISLWSEMTITE